jgi:hypothetical protein
VPNDDDDDEVTYYFSVFEVPTTKDEWRDTTQVFKENWDVYNSFRVMDG